MNDGNMDLKIRYLSRDDEYLYVLGERGIRDWSIKAYKHGFDRLKAIIENYFGSKILLPRCHIDGIREEEWVMRDMIKQGVKVEYISSREEANKFYRLFIEDFLLKAHPNLDWDGYLKTMSNFPSGRKKRIEELIDRLFSEITSKPEIIGLSSEKNEFYRDVRFFNKLGLIFEGYESFTRYSQGEGEPKITSKKGRLAQPELVYRYPDESYIIKIKLTSKFSSRSLEQKQKAESELIKASYFIARNFDINFIPVYVRYRESESEARIAYTHYHFDKDSKQITPEDTYWTPIDLRLNLQIK